MTRLRVPRPKAPPWLLLLAVVTGATLGAANDSSVVGLFAASAARVEHGQLWRLLTSGLLAERPVAASLVSFALLAVLTQAICGGRVFWLSGVAGHVGSASLAYASIAIWRLVDTNGFQSAWQSPDYGVSAVSAAWLGAIAAAGWQARGNSWLGRAAIILSCLAIALFAYMLRPGLSILSSEHVTAFAIGAALACRGGRAPRWVRAADVAVVPAQLRRAMNYTGGVLRGVDPVAALAIAVAVVLIGATSMPTAIGALGERLHHRTPRCVVLPAFVVAVAGNATAELSCQDWRDRASLPALLP